MEKNITEVLLTPKVPKVVDNQQLFVYTPLATHSTPGILTPDSLDFSIDSNGVLKLKTDGTGNSLTEILTTINNSLDNLNDNKQDKIDENLTTNSKAVVGAINELLADVTEEVADRKSADTTIETNLNASIAAEANTRKTKDDDLQSKINSLSDSTAASINDLHSQVYDDSLEGTLAYKVAIIAANYITRLVTNLEYYYDKNTVDAKLAQVSHAVFKKVKKLPEVGETNYIYLVPKQNNDSTDNFDEWIWALQEKEKPEDPNVYAWERLGSTDVDLSDYPTFAQMNAAIAEAVAAINIEVDGTTVSKNTVGKLQAIALTDGTNTTTAEEISTAITIERL